MVDFHTHTFMCEHAAGKPEQYIEAALARGISILGFSDHAPLPDGLREGVTMYPHQTEEYISMIEALREKYDTRISVRLGFEVDFPLRPSFDRKYFTDSRIDYLIDVHIKCTHTPHSIGPI
ncbi:MAG: PHP domain-containing protein [Spirochaetota bacterium]